MSKNLILHSNIFYQNYYNTQTMSFVGLLEQNSNKNKTKM